jgi:hypothetical protein
VVAMLVRSVGKMNEVYVPPAKLKGNEFVGGKSGVGKLEGRG